MAITEIVRKLNMQMNLEFRASGLCLRLGDWCSKHELNGAAIFMRVQAQGNITRMMSMFDYIKQAGINPVLWIFEASDKECSSLEDLLQKTLEDCEQRCASLAMLTAEAKVAQDETTLRFLSEMEKKQQQDGKFVQTIFDKVRAARRAGLGLAQTDQHLLSMISYPRH